ncbi:nitronate monooxygenase [Sulfitobacter sp. S0837]|uniref:NAD(P)H-dependent flavin oxidoreductase n=1 Tax=Sulfitobacter maritimus TaxID=2741719 RepID=UPI00158210D8|nr:nitronate monooxygenase [Sulfitobacter maritimus]NUH66813.1 nitronate monooxygenase [Sulfitobacter maritimus]
MLTTRLTERLGIKHPIIQAPMAFAAGGRLAAAVSSGGGLGMIGGAYDAGEWIAEQQDLAGNQSVGCGFITWALRAHPQALEEVLARGPAAVFLSFGDPADFVPAIQAAKVPLICQVQTLRDAAHAIDLGAEVIVAQGAEAGGHGERRATFTLVPEIADHIARHAPDTLLCAAGGVGDGRGLAAALMLGADGVVIGSRFWASDEALVHPAMLQAAIKASGDDTLRSTVTDIMRGFDWPKRYTGRVLRNDFTDRWHHDPEGLRAVLAEERPRWQAAVAEGDARVANAFVGEVTGLIHDIRPAAEILHDIVKGAEQALAKSFTR